jgi:uncharacterized protein YydD (DUF2326 family)
VNGITSSAHDPDDGVGYSCAGPNLLRFRIDAHIEHDAAEGINEAKIFCYDMTLLLLRRGHSVDFLAHDSGLFSPIDSRQRLKMFRMADALAREHGFQYIAALNEHDISSMAPTVAGEMVEFDRLFSEPNVILRLTDQSPRERLLGVDVDMNYLANSDSKASDPDADEA